MTAFWNETDEERLHELRNRDNMSWEDIATILGRTPSACRNQYKGKIPWSQEERRLLFMRIEMCTEDDDVDWNAVMSVFPNKTMKECKAQLRISQRRNHRFTPEERDAARMYTAKECYSRFGTHTFHSWKSFIARLRLKDAN